MYGPGLLKNRVGRLGISFYVLFFLSGSKYNGNATFTSFYVNNSTHVPINKLKNAQTNTVLPTSVLKYICELS
jgi:hypothetical protein